ncbi:MAG: restriction endonuclease subunit S [Defluviitaleaceae bacterium]|nr:restriction endonuclease subunit S [Defluviitaleaceae bacterium]
MPKTKMQSLPPEERLAQALVPEDEQPYAVPENWVWTYWKVCGNLTAGIGFKPAFQGFTEYDIPFYKVGSLKHTDDFGYLHDGSNTINEEIRAELKAALIPANSTIFAKIGEAIRLNRRSLNSAPCCIDNNLIAFVPFPVCNHKFAFFWSTAKEFYGLANATTVPAIRKSDLERLPFPLPPLPEQHRIVTRIESLFEKLDRAKELVASALSSFENRKAAILHKAFTGELTAAWREENSVSFETWTSKKTGRVRLVGAWSFETSSSQCTGIIRRGVSVYTNRRCCKFRCIYNGT